MPKTDHNHHSSGHPHPDHRQEHDGVQPAETNDHDNHHGHHDPLNHQDPAVTADDSQQRLAELTEALQRERADATNLRRRHQADLAALRGRATSEIVRQLLPVIDNFERSFKHTPEELQDSDYVKGITGIVRQFEKVLSDMGVERIAAVGQPFDPRYHEAVSMQDGDGSQEMVSEELQAGYRLGNEVIRPAMVRVKLQ